MTQKALLFSIQRMSHQPLRTFQLLREGHVNGSKNVESARMTRHQGVGEALVFSLKTSHQLKTGGLVYRPAPGR